MTNVKGEECEEDRARNVLTYVERGANNGATSHVDLVRSKLESFSRRVSAVELTPQDGIIG
jgi:hypothetical protein